LGKAHEIEKDNPTQKHSGEKLKTKSRLKKACQKSEGGEKKTDVTYRLGIQKKAPFEKREG